MKLEEIKNEFDILAMSDAERKQLYQEVTERYTDLAWVDPAAVMSFIFDLIRVAPKLGMTLPQMLDLLQQRHRKKLATEGQAIPIAHA